MFLNTHNHTRARFMSLTPSQQQPRSLDELRVKARVEAGSRSDILGIEQVLPSQYFPNLSSNLPNIGELRLMSAILEDAIACAKRPPHRRSKPSQRHEMLDERERAQRWFLSDTQSEHPYTFLNICAVFNLNANAVRRAVRREWRS